MIENVPLVGSLSTGFGETSAAAFAPTARTPNLVEASQDFVGMLYSYMFSQMRESSSHEEDGLFSGPHVDMLMGFLDQEIGKQLAGTQGEGLAKEMLSQLSGGQPIEQAVPQNAASVLGRFDARREGFAAMPSVSPVSGNFDPRLEGVVAPPELPSAQIQDPSQEIMAELYKLNRRE
jgi:Rod binding domain-containing protein